MLFLQPSSCKCGETAQVPIVPIRRTIPVSEKLFPSARGEQRSLYSSYSTAPLLQHSMMYKECVIMNKEYYLINRKIDSNFFFLLERDLFHEIDQMFGQNVGISGCNVMFHTPVREFWRLADDRKFNFRTQKCVKILKISYLKNGLRSAVAIYMTEIRPLIDFARCT